MAHQPAHLKRVLIELLVITASILLAFSLEAWWGQRVERTRFHEVVLAVRSEFAGAQAELARARAVHESTAGSLEALLALMGPDPEDSAEEALYPLWAEVRFTSTDVPRGVLSNLLASGDISTLPNGELRGRLSAWPAAREDHIATEAMYEDALEQLRALASERSPLPPGWGSPDYATSFPLRPRAVLTDFAIENALARALHLLRIVLNENRNLSAGVGEILTGIDAFIATR